VFEKLKDKLFNLVHKDKVQKINRMQRQLEKLEDKRLDLEYDLVHERNELYDVDKKYEVNRKYIIEGAKKEFNGIDDYKKQQIIDKLTYLDLGEVTYLEVIKSISGISQIDLYNYSLDDSQDYSQSNMDRLYNMDNSKIINLYKGLESISNETWNEINANFFAEMVYKEGYGVEWMVSQVEQEEEKRLENEKSLFGVEVEICDKMFIKDGVDFFGMLEKDLNLDDGSFIKKDTEFIIDGFRDGKYEIHFAKEEGNIYHNDFGDKYYFTSKEINQFAKVEEHEHGIAFDNIDIGGEFQLSVKELNIVAATDYDEIKSTIWSDTPVDNLFSLIYLENHGVNLDDYLKQYLKEVEESIAKNESFKSFGKYLSDDITDQLEAEYEKVNDPWNNIDVKPFKEKIYERISADINKLSGAREIESFLQENKLKENPYKDIGDDYMMNPKREEKEYQSSNNLFTNIFENKNKELSFEIE